MNKTVIATLIASTLLLTTTAFSKPDLAKTKDTTTALPSNYDIVNYPNALVTSINASKVCGMTQTSQPESNPFSIDLRYLGGIGATELCINDHLQTTNTSFHDNFVLLRLAPVDKVVDNAEGKAWMYHVSDIDEPVKQLRKAIVGKKPYIIHTVSNNTIFIEPMYDTKDPSEDDVQIVTNRFMNILDGVFSLRTTGGDTRTYITSTKYADESIAVAYDFTLIKGKTPSTFGFNISVATYP